MALEGQSTDDGRIFVNVFQDEEDIEHLGAIVYRSELSGVLGHAKSFLKTKSVKQSAIDQETEHGVAFWHLDDERTLVVALSTALNCDLVEQAGVWFGETHGHFDRLLRGTGVIARDDLSSVMVVPPSPTSSKKMKTS